MDGVTLRQRLRYEFDNTMSRGTGALVGWLALATSGLVLFGTLLVVGAQLAPKEEHAGFLKQMMLTLFHALDPAMIGDDEFTWAYVLPMLGVTIGGIFVVSALIGVIATAFEEKLAELRKGRSVVLEQGHTLILGWSEAVFTILRELRIANANERRPSVVILADQDKVEMEDAIAARVGDMANTRVVCRSGSPIDLSDLEIVNPREARAIIVLSSTTEEPDAEVIKTILALTQNPKRRPEPYHIVAEIEDLRNMDVARLVGGDEAVLVNRGDLIARLVVQASRQSGVSVVYTEFFDYGGDEIYFRHDRSLVGKTYGDALFAYESCAVIGLRTGGSVTINPDPATVIGADDEIVALAEDDAALEHAPAMTASIEEGAIVDLHPLPAGPHRALLLGWNSRCPIVVRELAKYTVPGSLLTVVADPDLAREAPEELAPLATLEVEFRPGNTTDRDLLDSLDVASYDNVIVMCYSDTLDVQRADARTLITLLHLRDIAAKGAFDVAIVSETLDDRNRELAQVTKVDDVIVSEQIVSLILTQISENRALAAVFHDLLDAEGSEIYLRPVESYVSGPASFANVVEAARRRRETAIGYRSRADEDDPEKSFGIVVNPPKSARLAAAAGDRVIVLADGV